jgi:imidazolonepropionase-like amidohydrolase
VIARYAAQAADRLKRARKVGVKIAAGSDNWFKVDGKTCDAAELLGWSDRVGTLEPGRFTDLIAVDGDPLRDVSELRRARFVMKGGEVVKGP